MISIRDYNYNMGFRVDGHAIPDPAEFSGMDSALDSEAGRDANGYLHRTMVALKRPLKIGWKNIEFSMMQRILSYVKGSKFSFTYPSPESMNDTVTIEAYAGDRSWNVTLVQQVGDISTYIGDLSFSVIEY